MAWFRTLNLSIMGQMFYHSATKTCIGRVLRDKNMHLYILGNYKIFTPLPFNIFFVLLFSGRLPPCAWTGFKTQKIYHGSFWFFCTPYVEDFRFWPNLKYSHLPILRDVTWCVEIRCSPFEIVFGHNTVTSHKIGKWEYFKFGQNRKSSTYGLQKN